MASPAAPVVTPPATVADDTLIDLDAHRAAKGQPAPKAEPVEDDPDVKDDPELAQEIDALETPKDNESPQEKAARTKRLKASASKSQKTRYKNQRDAALGKLTAAETELADWRAGRRSSQPPLAAKPAAEPTDDPKPTLKDFPLEKFKDEEDPYDARSAALAEAVARWGARDEHRKQEATARASRQREQEDQDARAALKTHGQRETEAKARIPDYDAVVAAATFPRTIATEALLELVFRSDVSADVVYHLAKHQDVTHRLLQSGTRDALVLAFAEVQADVKAALKAKDKPPAPPKVIATAEPTHPVSSSAGSGAILRNPYQDPGTEIDLDEARAFKRAQRR